MKKKLIFKNEVRSYRIDILYCNLFFFFLINKYIAMLYYFFLQILIYHFVFLHAAIAHEVLLLQ